MTGARRLRPAGTLAEFLSRPTGSYLSGAHFLSLCETEALYACFIWGKPRGGDARAIVDALSVEMRPEAVPHRTYIDFTGLTGVDAESFSVFRDFLERIKARQKEVTLREAIIRPGGLVGSVIAGFMALYPQPYPTGVFAEPADGAEYLSLEGTTLRRWEALRDEVRGVPPELRALRRVLEAHRFAACRQAVGRLTTNLAAKAPRLRDDVSARARRPPLDRASTLVTTTDDKLATVASRVGFSSYQHFSDWFRRKSGHTAEECRRLATQPPASE